MDAPFKAVENGVAWSSQRIAEYLANNQGAVFLAFSRGKDSVGAWLQLRAHGIDVIPYHMDIVPGLSFVDESLDYYESFFGTRIMRMLHPLFYDNIGNGFMQTPKAHDHFTSFSYPFFTRKDVNIAVARKHGVDFHASWFATGVRSDDSPMRQLAMKTHGPMSAKERSAHVIWDWSRARLFAELYKHDVKLPVDYKMWGKTFDGLHYEFLSPIKENFPKDYERILFFMPLLEAYMYRYRRAWR